MLYVRDSHPLCMSVPGFPSQADVEGTNCSHAIRLKLALVWTLVSRHISCYLVCNGRTLYAIPGEGNLFMAGCVLAVMLSASEKQRSTFSKLCYGADSAINWTHPLTTAGNFMARLQVVRQELLISNSLGIINSIHQPSVATQNPFVESL